MAVVMAIVIGQLGRTGTSRGRRRGADVVLRFSSLVLLLLLLLPFGTFLGVLGDALVGDPLAPFAHVSSQGALLLLLAERARVLGGFALAGFALSSYRLVLVPAVLLLNPSTALGRTVQRILQRPVGELFIVPVQRIPERPILDAIAHVVHIHPEGGERFGRRGLSAGQPQGSQRGLKLERALVGSFEGLLAVLSMKYRVAAYSFRESTLSYYGKCSKNTIHSG